MTLIPSSNHQFKYLFTGFPLHIYISIYIVYLTAMCACNRKFCVKLKKGAVYHNHVLWTSDH